MAFPCVLPHTTGTFYLLEGDVLTPLLFIFALEYAIKKVRVEHKLRVGFEVFTAVTM
jgi:hypothetical protein